MELILVIILAFLTFRLDPTTIVNRLPRITRPPIPRSHGFHRASGTIRLSDYSPGIASHFASAYRVPYSGATRKPCKSSWGHTPIFHTVPPANTLVRWVDESAFASIVQTRPCPTFGRPVRHRMAPLTTARYFSSNPSDSTSRWTPCLPVVLGQNTNLGIPLAVSSVSGFVPV